MSESRLVAAIEAVGDGGAAFAVVGDLGVGEGCDELRFEVGDGGVGDGLADGGRWELEEDALGGAIAGSEQAGGLRARRARAGRAGRR